MTKFNREISRKHRRVLRPFRGLWWILCRPYQHQVRNLLVGSIVAFLLLLSWGNAAPSDTTAVRDPSLSHLFWMATGDIGPNERFAIGLHEFVVPSLRISLFNTVQLSAFSAGFSSSLLLGAKVRIVRSETMSISIGTDIPSGPSSNIGSVTYWYGSASFHLPKSGIHATLTNEHGPLATEEDLFLQLGGDYLLRLGSDGSGLKIIVESMASRLTGGLKFPSFVLAGIRAFGVSSSGDLALYFPPMEGGKYVLLPLVSVSMWF